MFPHRKKVLWTLHILALVFLTLPSVAIDPMRWSLNAFRQNSFYLTAPNKAALQDVVRVLRSEPRTIILIEGYRAKTERKRLDYWRAKEVRRGLMNGSFGISLPANRIMIRERGISEHGWQVELCLLPDRINKEHFR